RGRRDQLHRGQLHIGPGIAVNAETADAETLPEPVALLGRADGDGHPQDLVTALQNDRRPLARPKHHEIGDILEARCVPVRNRKDAVARLKPGLLRDAAFGDTRDEIIRPRRADRREEGGENDDRQQKIRGWPGQHDEEALPDWAQGEGTITVLGRDRVLVDRAAYRAHVADEAHVTAQRQPADFPARALLVGPAGDFMAESDREGLGRTAQPARQQIVAELMKEDERAERTDECDQDKPQWRLRQHQCHSSVIDASTRVRVVRSISSTSAIDWGAARADSASACSTARAISGKRIRPLRKPSTATSFAALSTTGAAPPACLASRAMH